MTFTPSQSTVATTQVQDLTVFIPGTGTKVVKLQVCDFNGANCVTAGNSTLGTLAEIGRDSNNNPLVRYTAPTALPASTVCQPVDTGCRLKLKAKLKGARKKAFATVTLTAPGVTGSPTGGGDGSSNRPVRSANGRFVAFASLATNLIGAGNDSNGFQDVFLFDTCLGASPCTPGISRVSVANDGSEADGPSHSPAISADGRFISFVSSATNLLGPGGDTNGLPDIYLRDTCLGGDGGCVPSTLRVSEGSEPDDFSDSPAISGNGRYVVFRSAATNLLGPGSDTNGHPDIFLRDTCLGADPACVPSTVRVSEATDGTPGNGSSEDPAVSVDGRFVVFSSLANTLVGGDSNGGSDVFLRDTCTGVASGCTPTTTRMSVDTGGGDGDGGSDQPTVSGSGRYVVFRSAATDLIGSDINSLTDVFLRDTCLGAGAGCTPTTTRVSVASDGSEAAGGDTLEPVVSADGRFVAFRSAATNLVSADGNGAADIFVRDLCGAEPGCTPSTRRISVTSGGGEGAAGSFEPSLSGDGRFAAFISASDLTGDGSGGAIENVFLARTGAVIVPLLWVTNHDANTVSVIDTELNTVITTIPVGTSPKGIVLSPDGTRAYVTNYDDDTVSVIDTASRTVIATIAVGDGPWGLTWSPNVPTVLYVSNNLADTVSAISTTGNEVFATIALSPGACPRGMGSGGDGAGTLAYCLDEIEVFNTDPADPVDYHTIVPADFLSVGDGPAGAALVHDDSNHDVVRLYVSLENIDRVQVFDTDTEPDTLIATIVVGDKPNGAAVTPDLSRVYVANSGSGTVSVINTANNSVIKTVTVGSNPTGVGISPDGARVYVTNRGSGTVSVIDTSTNAVVATIAVGAGPCCEQGMAIQLGRSL
jgi:YVTN family beta-propeller protein